METEAAGADDDAGPSTEGDGGDDGGGEGANPGEPNEPCALPVARMWKLTPRQLARTIDAILPGAPSLDPRVTTTLPGGKIFSNETGQLEANQPHVETLMAMASTLAEHALAEPMRIHPCLEAGLGDEQCVEDSVAEFGERAFRRPLGAEELADLMALYRQQRDVDGEDTALWQVMRAVFMSPRFLYRSEIGAPDQDPGATEITLDAYERASALSYFITDGPPDEELLDAAGRDDLGPEQLEAHARRLLATEAGAEGIVQFLFERFGGERLEGTVKDPELYPNFDDDAIDELSREPREFARYVLQQDDGSFSTLMTAGYTIANATVASFYGDGLDAGEQFERVELPAGRRQGILTQPGLLAALARPDEGDIVHRGLFVRERLLCDVIPSPPEDVDAVPPPPDPTQTHRERMSLHTEDPTCAACHELIDPLGFAFEHYDAVGSWRDEDVGQPVDASGSVELDDQVRTFQDAVELSNILADSPDARACFGRHTVEYAQGRRATAGASCDIEALVPQFEQTGGDITELVVAIVTHPSFVNRRR